MKTRIAMFRDPQFGWLMVGDREVGAPNQDSYGGSARVTEYVEVDFPEIPSEDAIKAQLAILDAKADAAHDKCNNELAVIEDARRKLLALPSPDSQP